jgi:hypothetical protein
MSQPSRRIWDTATPMLSLVVLSSTAISRKGNPASQHDSMARRRVSRLAFRAA